MYQFMFGITYNSSYSQYISGVPHRSILRPLLFILHINDLLDTSNLDLYLYVDNAKVMVPVSSHEDGKMLQIALDAILYGATLGVKI